MPRKTKKQKQLASVHKKAELFEIATKTLPVQSKREERMKETYTSDQLTEHTIDDLKKTILITACVITLEFLIFYANLRGIVSLTH